MTEETNFKLLEENDQYKKDLWNLRNDLSSLQKAYALEIAKKEVEKPLTKDERIADLEVKMAKLWYLLTDKEPGRGKQEKLSKFGRSFKSKLQ